MKVTKAMLHADLQPYYSSLTFFARLYKKHWFRRFSNWLTARSLQGKDIDGLRCEERYIPSSDPDWKIRLRIYRPEHHDGDRLPAMIYFHGGGYISGMPEVAGEVIESFIKRRPCVIIAPDYRKANVRPFPAGFSDCYETLLWARDNADDLGISPAKFMVAGHSAGGGLTAAVTLKARNTGDVQIAFQMPFYPMIDDLQPSDPARHIETPVWDSELNRIGWRSYLADLQESGSEIPAYAAPARNSDYRDFPPTITFVGTSEPFHQETVAYVKALKDENVEVAFREYEGCYHAFELLSPKANVSKDAWNYTFDNFAEFYDRYVSV